MADTPPLAGQVVVFAGTLGRLGRREAMACVERQHGRVAAAVSRDTTLLVIGEAVREAIRRGEAVEGLDARRLQEVQKWNLRSPGRIRTLPADEFYQIVGLAPAAMAEPSPARYSSRTIRGLYPALREDRLRYLERWGLIHPALDVSAGEARPERVYAFGDLAVLRQASAELGRGVTFRAVVRDLLADRQGQLSFDFQPGTSETTPAKVIALPPRALAGARTPGEPAAPGDQGLALATAYFTEGAELDSGDATQREAAMDAYRRALALDPSMTAALVNLANIHYARDQIIESEALYEKALALDPTCFEAHFNLGNVYHDTGRFEAAARCYTSALAIDPAYADAHFYLAVTLEKLGRSGEARPHWVAYQRIAPNGEWVELAREFSE